MDGNKILDLPVCNLGEVGALGRPHGSRTEAEDEGRGDEGVELGIELGGDVGGVAEHADNEGPLDLEPVDQYGRQEHARDDERGVHRCVGECSKIGDL